MLPTMMALSGKAVAATNTYHEFTALAGFTLVGASLCAASFTGTPTGFNVDVNDDGAVVGILQPFTGSVSKAFVWKSALTVLPGLGHAAEARAINSNGEIIGAAETNPGRLTAVAWSAAGALSRLPEPAALCRPVWKWRTSSAATAEPIGGPTMAISDASSAA